MKKVILLFLFAALAIAMLSCTDDESRGASDKDSDGGTSTDEQVGDSFVLKAIVKGKTGELEVEVIESDYAFGTYRVLISSETEFKNGDGDTISLSDIKIDDTVEIVYGGQVMMSYPPQIVAKKVILK